MCFAFVLLFSGTSNINAILLSFSTTRLIKFHSICYSFLDITRAALKHGLVPTQACKTRNNRPRTHGGREINLFLPGYRTWANLIRDPLYRIFGDTCENLLNIRLIKSPQFRVCTVMSVLILSMASPAQTARRVPPSRYIRGRHTLYRVEFRELYFTRVLRRMTVILFRVGNRRRRVVE